MLDKEWLEYWQERGKERTEDKGMPKENGISSILNNYLKQVPFKGCPQAGSDYCVEKCSQRFSCDYWTINRHNLAFLAWLYDNRPHLNFMSEELPETDEQLDKEVEGILAMYRNSK